MVVRRPLYLVFAAVLMSLALVVVTAGVSSSENDRMTREELLEEAQGPNAKDLYDYYFSEEELAYIDLAVEPYNCAEGKGASLMTLRDEYFCGIRELFERNAGNFVPPGYVFSTTIREGDKLVGITVVRYGNNDFIYV